jgi:Tol biopolymer transport system component
MTSRARILPSAVKRAPRCFSYSGNLYRKDISGGGKEELILNNAHFKFASDWSRDGRYLLFTEVDPKTKGDIRILPDPGGSSGAAKPYPFLHTDADESEAQLSPDGRWIAYVSDESGLPNVYVSPFPSGSGRWKAPGEASGEPRWGATARSFSIGRGEQRGVSA